MRRIYIIISAFFIISASLCKSSYAEGVNDGFETARTIESRYFTIFIESGVDLEELTMKLSVPVSIKAIIREPVSDSYNLPDQLDIFYLAVSEIMDTRLKDFKCKLKICRSASSLSDIAKRLFGRKIQPGGFYVYAIDTLYVDAQNVTINIFGHELSHAVQNHYFVVPPPETIQEVLAGYVEYQLRKYTHSLPK
jgi:hypothetical protein